VRILITGAAGFIGSHLMDKFIDSSNDVWGFDNFTTGRRKNNPEAAEIDITDRERLYSFANLVGPDVVIHCAASYADPNLWHRDTDTNVSGGINAALVAKHHDAHLIYFQTILPPISSYAISKIAAEQYMRMSGVKLTVCRMANVYGPRNLSGPIPAFYKRISAGQPCLVVDTTRDMIFIDDVVRCVQSLVENKIEGTYDICSGEQTSIMDLYAGVAAALGHKEVPPLIPPDPDDVQGTVSLNDALASWKWERRVPLQEGIKKTVESYSISGVDETYTHLRLKG
jgi:UDP-glucose 4-epimerase